MKNSGPVDTIENIALIGAGLTICFLVIFWMASGDQVVTREIDSHSSHEELPRVEKSLIQTFHESSSKNALIAPMLGKHHGLDFILNGMLGEPNKLTITFVENFIASAGGEAFKINDTNPETGSMLLLRSKGRFSAYDHVVAQFFKEKGQFVAHNVSFIVRNENNAFTEVAQELSDEMNRATDRPDAADEIRAWALENGYVFWMRELEQRDIDEDDNLIANNIKPGSLQFGLDLNIH